MPEINVEAAKGVAYASSDDGVQTTILPAITTPARQALCHVECTETFATGTGAKPDFLIGETDSTSSFFATGELQGMSAGDVLVESAAITSTKDVFVTAQKATGTGAGAIVVTMVETRT